MGIMIYADGTALPSPVAVTAADEIIWSANTGRSASGLMLGDVVAEKATFGIRWGVLSQGEYELIRRSIRSGFQPFTITVDGASTTISAYRGTLTAELMGTYGGTAYYKDAAATIIQR